MTTHHHHTPNKWGQIKRARWGQIKLTFPQESPFWFASDFVIEIRRFLTLRWEAFRPDPEEG